MAFWLLDSASKLKDVGSSLSSAGQCYLAKVSSLRLAVAGKLPSANQTNSHSDSPDLAERFDDSTRVTSQFGSDGGRRSKASDYLRMQRNFEQLLTKALELMSDSPMQSTHTFERIGEDSRRRKAQKTEHSTLGKESKLRAKIKSQLQQQKGYSQGAIDGMADDRVCDKSNALHSEQRFIQCVFDYDLEHFDTDTAFHGATASGHPMDHSSDTTATSDRMADSSTLISTTISASATRRSALRSTKLKLRRDFAQMQAFYGKLQEDFERIKNWQHGTNDGLDSSLLRRSAAKSEAVDCFEPCIKLDLIPTWNQHLAEIKQWLLQTQPMIASAIRPFDSALHDSSTRTTVGQQMSTAVTDSLMLSSENTTTALKRATDSSILDAFEKCFADDFGDQKSGVGKNALVSTGVSKFVAALRRNRQCGVRSMRFSEKLRESLAQRQPAETDTDTIDEKEKKYPEIDEETTNATQCAAGIGKSAGGRQPIVAIMSSLSLSPKKKKKGAVSYGRSAAPTKAASREAVIGELDEMVSLLHSNVSSISLKLKDDEVVADTLTERTEESYADVAGLNQRLQRYVESTTGWSCTLFLMILFVCVSFVWTFGTIYLI